MTTQVFSTLNPSALGPGLDTALTGQVLTCKLMNQALTSAARCTLGKSSGVWYYEVVYYANKLIPGAPTSLSGLATVGIARASAPLNAYTGGTVESIGYNAGDGGVYQTGVAMTGLVPGHPPGLTLGPAAVRPTTLQIWVGVLVDLNALTITFLVNGNVYATAAVPAGFVWFPAVTIAGPTLAAYAVNAFVNTGQRALQFPQSTASGWYQIVSAQPLPIYLTTDYEGGYTSANTDSPQNQIYGPRLINTDSLVISRVCNVWPWGQSGSSSTYGSITIDNADGAYDYLLAQEMRDSQTVIKQGVAGSALTGFTPLATAIIDAVYAGGGSSLGGGGGVSNPAGEQSLTITLKDIMTLLQKPLQQKLFDPFDDVGVANSPLPITLGAVRNIAPMLKYTDTAVPGHQHYQLHDAQITNIATVRDKGSPLDPNATPPQYGPDGANGQFYLAAPPAGVLTMDASSLGAQVVIPGIADVLAGAGGFPTASLGAAGSAPPGFTIDTSIGSSVKQMGGIYAGTPNQMTRYLGTYLPWDPAAGRYGFHVHSNTNYLQPGNTYLITCKISNVQGQQIDPSAPAYGFALCTSITNSGAAYSITPFRTPINVGGDALQPQTYSFIYQCPGVVALPIYICMCSSLGFSATASGTISNLVVEQLGAYNTQQQLPLVGIDLTDYMTEVIINRAQLKAAQWVPADTQAITTAIAASTPTVPAGLNWSGGYGFGQHFPTAVNCDVAIQAPLDSFCAAAFTDNLGRVRVRRLVDPLTAIIGGAAIAGNYDQTSSQYGVTAEPDYAPGLTTQIGARRNYRQLSNTDLVTDYVALPAYLRTQFARRSQFILQSSIALANTYAFADSVAPLDSCLDDPTQAQFEIDRVLTRYGAQTSITRGATYGAPYSALPRFVTFTLCYDGVPPNLQFGDVITLNYARFGLVAPSAAVPLTAGGTILLAGYPLVVKDTVLTPSLQTLQITAWG